MWDARCSANFILPEQVSLKQTAALEPGAPVRLLPGRRDFCCVGQLAGWLRRRHSTSGSSRSARNTSRILFPRRGPLENRWSHGRMRGCLSDFARSLPAALGTLRSAMQRTTLTWLRQQRAQWPPALRCWDLLLAGSARTLSVNTCSCLKSRSHDRILRSMRSQQIKTVKVTLRRLN